MKTISHRRALQGAVSPEKKVTDWCSKSRDHEQCDRARTPCSCGSRRLLLQFAATECLADAYSGQCTFITGQTLEGEFSLQADVLQSCLLEHSAAKKQPRVLHDYRNIDTYLAEQVTLPALSWENITPVSSAETHEPDPNSYKRESSTGSK